jgi:hypothetical protein
VLVGAGMLVLLGTGAFVGRIAVGSVSVGGISTDGSAGGASVGGTSASVGASVPVGWAAVASGGRPAVEAVGVLVVVDAAFVVAVAATGDAVGTTVVARAAIPGWFESTAAGTIAAASTVLRSRSAASAAWGASGGRSGSVARSQGR